MTAPPDPEKEVKAHRQMLREHWFRRECRRRGLPEPVFEHRFDPVRKWRFDVAFPVYRVALEIQGGLFVQGRHSRGAALLKEHEKLNAAAAADWVVLYRVPSNVLAEETFTALTSAIALRSTPRRLP